MAIYLDDKVMNGKKEVLEYLKLPTNSIPEVRRKELEVLGGKRDRDGNLRISKSIYGVAEYTVFVPLLGREVKFRLATRQTPNKDRGFDYAPKNIGIEPAEDGTVLVTDELEFVFWFLRPMCDQSPFRKSSAKSFYRFKDNEANSKAEAAQEEARIDAMSMIYGSNRKSFKELREVAKGFNIPGVDDMSDAVVQSELKKQVIADPVLFYNKATSRELVFSGKVQHAIDQGILVVQNINGMKRWYLGSDEILPLSHGIDDVKALKEFLSEQWYLYSDTIQKLLDNKSIESNLANPSNDFSFFEQESFKGPEIKAELNASTIKALKEIEETPFLKEKILKLVDIDPEDPSIHFKTRESYDKNKHYIEAYRESQKGL